MLEACERPANTAFADAHRTHRRPASTTLTLKRAIRLPHHRSYRLSACFAACQQPFAWVWGSRPDLASNFNPEIATIDLSHHHV
jgi:hypothetical protein